MLLPAKSVNVKICIPFSSKVCCLSFAVSRTVSDATIIATTLLLVSFGGKYVIFFTSGGSLSIQSTFVSIVAWFPAKSVSVKICSPFSVNVCLNSSPSITRSDGITVTSTSLFVGSVVEYTISAVGSSLSIQSTVILFSCCFPSKSVYLKTYSPFSVNVCVNSSFEFNGLNSTVTS